MQDVYAFGMGVTAIAGLVVMECVALKQGINGKRLATVAALVAGVAGFAFGLGVS